MWHINEDSGGLTFQEVKVVLNPAQFGKVKPSGMDGETVPCFSFFAVKEYLRGHGIHLHHHSISSLLSCIETHPKCSDRRTV